MASQRSSPRQTWIVLDKIRFEAGIDADAWGRPKTVQPVVATVKILYDIGKAGDEDDFTQTLDYSKLNQAIREAAASSKAVTPFNFFQCVLWEVHAGPGSKVWGVSVRLGLPEALLNSNEGVTYDYGLIRTYKDEQLGDTSFKRHCIVSLNGIQIPCIIGVKDRERGTKQTLLVSVQVRVASGDLELDSNINPIRPLYETLGLAGQKSGRAPALQHDWKQEIAHRIFEGISHTGFLTVERAALEVERIVQRAIDAMWARDKRLQGLDKIQLVSLSTKKPSALSGVEGAGMQVVYGPAGLDQSPGNQL